MSVSPYAAPDGKRGPFIDDPARSAAHATIRKDSTKLNSFNRSALLLKSPGFETTFVARGFTEPVAPEPGLAAPAAQPA
jgi:hypothetical protein